MKKLLGCCCRCCSSSALVRPPRRVFYLRASGSRTAATTAPEQFVEIPPGAGSLAIGERLVAAGVVRDLPTYRLALWMSGQGRHLKAGEYRFDRAMTPFEVIDKIARGDVFVISVTFPEGLTIAEMAKIFESHGLGPAAAFVEAAQDAVARFTTLDPAAQDLEGYLFPETYALPRNTDAPKLVRPDGRPLRACVHAGTARRGRRAPADGAPGGDAGVDRRKGNGEGRGAAAGRGGLHEPAAHRHAAAVRSHGHLRASARRHATPATCGATISRSIRRTTRIAIRDCRQGRSRRRAGRRSRPRCIPPTSTASTSSAATMARTCSRRRSTSTIGTCRSIRCSTSGISRPRRRVGRRGRTGWKGRRDRRGKRQEGQRKEKTGGKPGSAGKAAKPRRKSR